jgi:hypothetical protein
VCRCFAYKSQPGMWNEANSNDVSRKYGIPYLLSFHIHANHYSTQPFRGMDLWYERKGTCMNGCAFLDSVKRFLPYGIFSPPHPRLPNSSIVLLLAKLFTTSLPVMATAVSRTHRWQQHLKVFDHGQTHQWRRHL